MTRSGHHHGLKTRKCMGCKMEFRQTAAGGRYCLVCMAKSGYEDRRTQGLKGARPGESLADYLERRTRAEWNIPED